MTTKSLLSFVLSISALIAMSACASKPKTETSVATPQAVVAETESSHASAKVDEKKSADSAESTVTCALDKDKREISVVAKDKGCEVHYSKAGTTSTVASDKVGLEHCEKTVAKMRGKLVAGGYKCD